MSTNPAPKDLADATWKQVFQEGPYTAVVMIDYLRAQAGHADWSVVLKAGYTNKKGLTGLAPAALKKEAIKKDKNLNVIWGGKTGRCTSFAVKVLDQLEKKSPGTFDFKIYDIGRHRVARCAKTEVLIDSSAKDGAFALPEGQWTRMEGSDASWKWVKGQSKFEKREGVSGVVSCLSLLFLHVRSGLLSLYLSASYSYPTPAPESPSSSLRGPNFRSE